MLKGQTFFTGRNGSYQEILKGVELDIVDEDDCQKQLRTTRLGEDFILDRSFLCAGGKPNKDACKGKQKVCCIFQPAFVCWALQHLLKSAFSLLFVCFRKILIRK